MGPSNPALVERVEADMEAFLAANPEIKAEDIPTDLLTASGSQNMGPSNPGLTARVEADMEAFLAANPEITRDQIPTDLVTASGSGLDPDISPEAAAVQLPAISEASGLSLEQLEQIVADHTEGKLLGIFGAETVNVLGVNIDIAEAMGLE